MSKHLKKSDIEAIINIIYSWDEEKITWDAICEAAEPVVGKKPTRQSLNAIKQIKEAYTLKKSGLKVHGPRKAKPVSLNAAAERIARQQSEIDSLKAKNAALLEQFVVWQYNSYKYGLKEHQLNEPLPRIDRDRTETDN